MKQKSKVTSFGLAIFSLSAVQAHFDINFPWSFGYIRKLAFSSPLENCFNSCLSVANIPRIGISNLHRHRPLRVLIYTLVEWNLEDKFWTRVLLNAVQLDNRAWNIITVYELFQHDTALYICLLYKHLQWYLEDLRCCNIN